MEVFIKAKLEVCSYYGSAVVCLGAKAMVGSSMPGVVMSFAVKLSE